MATEDANHLAAGYRVKSIIDGTPVKLNDRKVAVHSVVASGKAGEYTITVKMEYVEPDGRKMTRTMELQYSITDNK